MNWNTVKHLRIRGGPDSAVRLHLGILFLLILVVSICTIEMAGRISAKSYLRGKITEGNSLLAKRSSETAAIDGTASTETGRRSLFADRESIERLKQRVSMYEIVLDGIEQLDFSGASHFGQTIYGLNGEISRISLAFSQSTISAFSQEMQQIRLAELDDFDKKLDSYVKSLDPKSNAEDIKKIEAYIKGQSDFPIILKDEHATVAREVLRLRDLRANLQHRVEEKLPAGDTAETSRAQYSDLMSLYICYLPTDMVLALSVILCGAIGSISASIRMRETQLTRTAALGTAAGFTCFLALKGGKFLFLVQQGGEHLIPTNPFAAAFFGILVGLFTERAYLALAHVFERAIQRVTGEASLRADASAESRGPKPGSGATQ